MHKRFFPLFFFLLAINFVAFPQQDSLFNSWNKRLDAIDLSNIDRLPIYRFTLNEVRDEAKQYANSENAQYTDLQWKMNYISNILDQRLARIDSLFYAKALQFEQQGNELEAVFYYKRSLDFNPSYCLSIEKLSFIYTKNGQNLQQLELLNFLSLDNRLGNCNPKLFDFAFDSLIVQSNRLTEQRNYYDALKVLDTMKLFLDHVPQEKYARTFAVLLELAQNGIYASYYDIINKSIKVNKLPLAKEYIYGLFLAIEKNQQQPNHNFFFSGAVQNLIFAHRGNANRYIQRKEYGKAIETTDSMALFLNNVNYLYSDDLFFDIYSSAYTAQYSNILKNNDPSAEEFYQKYNSYIIYVPVIAKNQGVTEENKPSEQVLFNETPKEDKADFSIRKSLYDRVNEYVFNDADFSVLDSFFVWKKFLRNIYAAGDSIKDFFADLKMRQLMVEALSKTNQYAWGNELLKAIHLLEKIDAVFVRFVLQEDSVLAEKNTETTDLLEDRVQKYANEELELRFVKAGKLVEQKQYYAAYLLLTEKNPLIERVRYKSEWESPAVPILLPAMFQKEEQEAKDRLEMGYFSEGFAKYEQVYAYYKENEIVEYGLECDDLQNFVEKSNREKYHQQLTLYYIEQNLCEKALSYLFHTVNKGMGNKQWLEAVGEEMKKTTNCGKSIKNQRFTKEHKPFLDAYFGKKKGWWYVLRSILLKK